MCGVADVQLVVVACCARAQTHSGLTLIHVWQTICFYLVTAASKPPSSNIKCLYLIILFVSFYVLPIVFYFISTLFIYYYNLTILYYAILLYFIVLLIIIWSFDYWLIIWMIYIILLFWRWPNGPNLIHIFHIFISLHEHSLCVSD